MRWAAVVALVGAAWAVGALVSAPPASVSLAAFSTPLKGRTSSQVHNARRALDRLNGAVIEPGAEWSFNTAVGSLSRDEGFRKAPVSYNGTLIDDWGGGVCQTSTTLYNAALLSGLEIVERHAHRFAPSYVPPGRDAAVAFSNIDLKLRNPHPYPVTLRGTVEHERLTIGVWGPPPRAPPPPSGPEIKGTPAPHLIVQEIMGTQAPITRTLERPNARPGLRNSGKPGTEVVTYRVTGQRKQLLSVDSYPVMDRVVQVSGSGIED